MEKLPLDIKINIISFLPILTKEQKKLMEIINNYNYYFIKELNRLNIDVDKHFIDWSRKNYINDDVFNITLIQMQKFYLYTINVNNFHTC